MSPESVEAILPTEETVVHKTDVLDWSRLTRQPCEMEFRGGTPLDHVDVSVVLIQMGLVAVAAFAVSPLISVWLAPALDRPAITLLVMGLGVVWAIAAEIQTCANEREPQLPLIHMAWLARAVIPSLVLRAVVLTRDIEHPGDALRYWFTVSLPIAVLLLDRQATHAVHWMTASPTTDHLARAFGRHEWAWRLQRCVDSVVGRGCVSRSGQNANVAGVCRVTHAYPWGIAWVVAACLVPSVLITYVNSSAATHSVGTDLAVGITFGLLVGVVMRTAGDLSAVRQFLGVLAHWFYYGSGGPLPPSVFRSPCGSLGQRRAAILLTVAVCSLPISRLAAHSFMPLSQAGGAGAAAVSAGIPLSTENGKRPQALVNGGMDSERSWLWIAPVTLVAVLLPTLNFCLVGLLMTGPAISAYYVAFEAPFEFYDQQMHS